MENKTEFICRLCYINKHLISIYDGKYEPFRCDLVKIIENVTNIVVSRHSIKFRYGLQYNFFILFKINRNDSLTKVCISCSITACNFYMFKYTSIKNNNLRNNTKTNNLDDENSITLNAEKVEAVRNWLNRKNQYDVHRKIDNCTQTDDIESQTIVKECVSVESQTDLLNGSVDSLIKTSSKYSKTFPNDTKALKTEGTEKFEKNISHRPKYQRIRDLFTNSSLILKANQDKTVNPETLKHQEEYTSKHPVIKSDTTKHNASSFSKDINTNFQKHKEKSVNIEHNKKQTQQDLPKTLKTKTAADIFTSTPKSKSKEKKRRHLEKEKRDKKQIENHSNDLKYKAKKHKKKSVENHWKFTKSHINSVSNKQTSKQSSMMLDVDGKKEEKTTQLIKKKYKVELMKTLYIDLVRIDTNLINNNNNGNAEPECKKIKL